MFGLNDVNQIVTVDCRMDRSIYHLLLFDYHKTAKQT